MALKTIHYPNGCSADLVSVSYSDTGTHEVWQLHRPSPDSVYLDFDGEKFKLFNPWEIA